MAIPRGVRTPQSRSQSGPRVTQLSSFLTLHRSSSCADREATRFLDALLLPSGTSVHSPLTHSFIHLPFLLVSFYPVPTPPTSSESLLMCLLGLFQRKPSFLFFALTDFVLDHLSFRLLARISPLIQVSAKTYLSCGQTSWLLEPNQSPMPLDCLLCFSGLSDLS